MKLKNVLNISFNQFIRDKKNIISVVLISFMFALVLLCFSFKKSLNNYWNDSVGKLVDYRTYIVKFNKEKYDVNSAIEKLKTYNHVVETFDESSYLISMKLNDSNIVFENSSIFLIGTISNPIKLINGSNLDSVSPNENPIICAKQFYPFFEDAQEKYSVSKSIDITDKLGENINFSFITSEEVEKFKIVGLYDAKANHTEGNVCYTTLDVVRKLNKKYQFDVFPDTNEDINYVYMVIDNINNEELVINEIKKEKFDIVTQVLHINKTMGNNIISLLVIISRIFMFLTIGIILYISITKINKGKEDYFIMKTSGYSDSNITIIYILEFVFKLIFAFIVSIVLYKAMLIFFNKLYISDKIIFYDLKIGIDFMAIYINLLLSIIICIIISMYFKRKIKKISVIQIIK